MSTSFGVHFDEVETAASSLHQMDDNVDRAIANLKTRSQSQSATWDGAASAMYANIQSDIDQAQVRMNNVLTELHVCLAKNSVTYNDAEQIIKRNMGSFTL